MNYIIDGDAYWWTSKVEFVIAHETKGAVPSAAIGLVKVDVNPILFNGFQVKRKNILLLIIMSLSIDQNESKAKSDNLIDTVFVFG